MNQLPQEISDAIRFYKENRCAESRTAIHSYLISKTNTFDALLWLAKVSGDRREAMNAAELAYYLKPDSEIAQRAIATVSNQIPDDEAKVIELSLLKLTGITETQARAAIWPFRGLNRPIGVLLDEKCIDLRDIAWAAENAYDAVLQKAAQTLLLLAVFREKINETPKPVSVVEGRDNAGYRERVASLITGIFTGVTVSIAFLSLALPIGNHYFNFIDKTALSIITLLCVVVAYLSMHQAMQSSDEVINYRLGGEGERKVLDLLRASLYTPWTLFHNFECPNQKAGDADIVLVGSGGIWCFEVKNYSSQVRNIGRKWQYRSRFGWRKMSKNPTEQVQRAAVRIKDYLESFDIRIRWVQPVVVWAGDETKISLENPLVPVWTIPDIENKIEEFSRQQRLSEEQVSACSKALREAIEKVKKG